MTIIKTKTIILKNVREFLADAIFKKSNKKLPLIIFVHGYKGYKDWGAWELMGEKFANEGFYFVKFNFSHNGTTPSDNHNFEDLEAFGHNNYSKELSDLEVVIDFFRIQKEVDSNNIILLGHSRGGGISIIKAYENKNISRLITLASISTMDRFPKDSAVEDWKKEGVFFIENARTKQKMPHYYQFYEDFKKNEKRYELKLVCNKIGIPSLFIHGSKDQTVTFNHSKNLNLWTNNSQLKIIENANHTFGAKEPWESNFLPDNLNTAVEICLEFIKKSH